MNKLTITIIVIVLLIGGYYFVTKKNSPDSTDPVINTPQATTTTTVVSTTTTQTTNQNLEPVTFSMDSGGFYFKPNILRVKVGQKVTVKVNVAGGMHTFSIDEFGLDVMTPGGKITEVVFTPTKKGTFEFYCAMAGHRQKGQVGTLIVE